MKTAIRLLALISLLFAPPARAADALCQVIRRFETAPETMAGTPRERRWVEFHWAFDHSEGTIWSWGCRHSEETIATETCAWLQNNTNQEFSMMLPQAIMSCYRYRFPQHATYDWAQVAGTITLHGGHERKLILELDYRDLPQGEQAMRLALETDGVEYEPDEFSKIAPMPSVAGK